MRRVGAWLACGVLLMCCCPLSLQQQHGTAGDVKNRVVDSAPEGVLQNGIDDIQADGSCGAVLANPSCKNVLPGEARAADCVMGIINAAEVGDASAAGIPVTEACRQEVAQFYIARSRNINSNLPLAKACKQDVAKLCAANETAGENYIVCLRKQEKSSLSRDCRDEVLRVEQAAAYDYRADVLIVDSCHLDIDKYCAGGKPGGGRIQACLRDNFVKLDWECNDAVVTDEIEMNEDIRLSVRLFRRCVDDKRKYCPEVAPGQGAARECLLSHRTEPDMSPGCKGELDGLLQRRVYNLRLDTRLLKACETDFINFCGSLMEDDDLAGTASEALRTSIGTCLQQFLPELQQPECAAMVRQYQAAAAEDIRFDLPLAEACAADRAKLCSGVPQGSARVSRCLMRDRTRLSPGCRAALFDEELRFSDNIDFQYPMKQACTQETEQFCKDVPHGDGRVIRCLQESKGSPDFGADCSAQVRDYEQRSATDYRLNARLSHACAEDVRQLCSTACGAGRDSMHETCGGTVLRCLVDKRDNITSDSCSKEVLYFQKMEVTDYHNDVILAAACRADVDRFCADVESGEGRVHECLRQNRIKLSEQCRREELLLEQQEADSVELKPSLRAACAEERRTFCGAVRPGGARMFRCLTEKLADPDFGESCRREIVTKLKRRQANWKLDPPLRKACRASVQELCATEDSAASEQGLVLHCLVTNYDDLDTPCRKETSRAVYMALFLWEPGSLLTQPCDADVGALCLKDRPNMDKSPGLVGNCLAEILDEMNVARSTAGNRKASLAAANGHVLSEECRGVAEVAEPPSARQAFEASLAVALLDTQLSKLESTTGISMMTRSKRGDATGLRLTGWTALLGMGAMLVLAVSGGWYGYRRYRGGPDKDGYTLVIKQKRRSRSP